MLFASPVYGVFLFAAYFVFWSLRKRRLARALFLVAASYIFYFYGTYDAAVDKNVPLGAVGWSALCLGIIFVGSTLDFQIGKALAKTEAPRSRKALLLCSLVYYLGVLSLFKYFNFAADSITHALHVFGIRLSPIHLRLALPFGISFFTFETMSYTIDVYRREIEPSRRYLDYLLFVCFFPHLVAGPIVRPHQMLPQLAREPSYDTNAQARGLFRIAIGVAKKIVIGDLLATSIVNRVFDNPERYSSIEVLVAVYAYAMQIYADFSGYSDIAIGSAALFGYELPENFDAPYISQDLQEFWRRWHISLSSWLRDYLYIPLGGSRGSSWLTYRNLMITMLLGGLWHGASWNFVIWGALHGVALAGTRMWQRSGRKVRISSFLAVFFTFQYVCFAWIFFRAPSFAHATLMLSRIARLTTSTENISAKVVLMLLVAGAVHFIPRRWESALRDRFVLTPSLVQGILLAVAAYGVHLAAGAKAEPFVYGQF
jgi:D-alanyl-lipoteichoic acid acyltransferase DltB (MBOAT superfamily)